MERAINTFWHARKRLMLRATGMMVLCAAAMPCLGATSDRTGTLQLAWLDTSQTLHTAAIRANGAALLGAKLPQQIPLGSLWKLVAYAHWIESQAPAPLYRCEGKLKDEVYCCTQGESIDRAAALVASCGLYFASHRTPWDKPWGKLISSAPGSIQQAIRQNQLNENTPVELHAWLRWMGSWPSDLREQAQADLLSYWVTGPGKSALGHVGSQLRLKTFTNKQANGMRWAGASGWLYAKSGSATASTPLWFGSAGTSAQVVPANAQRILQIISDEGTALPQQVRGSAPPSVVPSSPHPLEPTPQSTSEQCIRVNYFARYPIRSVQAIQISQVSQVAPLRGSLVGRYKLTFENGNTLVIDSKGELQLSRGNQGQSISAELDLDEYVARVIDREAQAQPIHAARALAVAVRTYALAHGRMRLGCLDIDDSSHTQRVAPRPATEGAKAAALATNGFILRSGYAIPGQYHASLARDGVMSWRDAQLQAQKGMLFTDILLAAYPKASLASVHSQTALACEALAPAQQWLDRKIPIWKQQLSLQAGFSAPQFVQVCRLQSGKAHAHDGSHRIYVTGHYSPEEQIALTHEYLHLAFARHPRSQNELFIEELAKQLAGT